MSFSRQKSNRLRPSSGGLSRHIFPIYMHICIVYIPRTEEIGLTIIQYTTIYLYFKHVFTGVPKISNKFSIEYTESPSLKRCIRKTDRSGDPKISSLISSVSSMFLACSFLGRPWIKLSLQLAVYLGALFLYMYVSTYIHAYIYKYVSCVLDSRQTTNRVLMFMYTDAQMYKCVCVNICKHI